MREVKVMRTIALRFGEHFAPECGTIAAHQEIISQYNHVWYGKMGSMVGHKVTDSIMANEIPRILLIRSGRSERYWAYIEKIQYDVPALNEIPSYYRNETEKFKTWFKITKIEQADNSVMSKCSVASSGKNLGEASKQSMSPYFIIDYVE